VQFHWLWCVMTYMTYVYVYYVLLSHARLFGVCKYNIVISGLSGVFSFYITLWTYTIIFTDYATLGLLYPLEEYISPSILTVSALCLIVILGFMLKFSLEFIYLPSVERDVLTVI
jgi:hypothetical protein